MQDLPWVNIKKTFTCASQHQTPATAQTGCTCAASSDAAASTPSCCTAGCASADALIAERDEDGLNVINGLGLWLQGNDRCRWGSRAVFTCWPPQRRAA